MMQQRTQPAEIEGMTQHQIDTYFLALAINQANKSIPVDSAFCVGAILVKHNCIHTTGFSREIEGNTHAEQCCLLKLSALETAKGATMYSTMEPCGLRLSGNICCAKLIVEAGIKRVVIGCMEPETFVGESVGRRMLLDAAVEVVHLAGYDDECMAPNRHLK
jgi:pyrimidine deaminase RibD-like protein